MDGWAASKPSHGCHRSSSAWSAKIKAVLSERKLGSGSKRSNVRCIWEASQHNGSCEAFLAFSPSGSSESLLALGPLPLDHPGQREKPPMVLEMYNLANMLLSIRYRLPTLSATHLFFSCLVQSLPCACAVVTVCLSHLVTGRLLPLQRL